MIAKFLRLISRIICPGVSKYLRMGALVTAFFNLGNVRLLSQCGRFGQEHKVQLCGALPWCTDQATRRWHDWPPCQEVANRLNPLPTPQVVATSQFFFLLVIWCWAALKSRHLVKGRGARRVAGCVGSKKLDATKISLVPLQRQNEIQIPCLLPQTVEHHILQLQSLCWVFWLAGAVFRPCWA